MIMATMAELTTSISSILAGRSRSTAGRIIDPGNLPQKVGVEVLKAEDDHPIGVGRGDGPGCGG